MICNKKQVFQNSLLSDFAKQCITSCVLYIYILVCMCVCVYIYIYIYMIFLTNILTTLSTVGCTLVLNHLDL